MKVADGCSAFIQELEARVKSLTEDLARAKSASTNVQRSNQKLQAVEERARKTEALLQAKEEEVNAAFGLCFLLGFSVKIAELLVLSAHQKLICSACCFVFRNPRPLDVLSSLYQYGGAEFHL